MPKTFFKYWLPVYSFALIIFISSTISTPEGLVFIPHLDKVVHFFEYLLLALLLCRALVISERDYLRVNFKLFAVIFAFGYGCLMEFYQYFLPERFTSIADAFANGFGSITAVLFYRRK